ncbi:MAG: flippase [Actinobacteria bacterium]|nr:flippase [Actinomycetota bacterium]
MARVADRGVSAERDQLDRGDGSPTDHDAEADERTLARSGALNLIGAGSYGLLSFVLTVLIGRSLGASGTGAFLEALAVFNILSRTALLGTDVGLVRFIARARAEGRPGEAAAAIRVALGPVALVSSVFGLGMFVLAFPLARVLVDPARAHDLAVYLRTLAPFVPVAAVYQSLENGSRGFGTMLPGVVIERIARPALTPLAMAAVLAAGYGAVAVALAWAVPTVVALVPLALWTAHLVRASEREIRSRLARTADAAGAPAARPDPLSRRFWRFTLPRSLAGVFQLGLLWLDTILLGALAGSRAAGVYSASTRWLVAGNMVGMAVTLAFGPQITYVIAQRSAERTRRLFEFATVWFVLLAWPTFLTAMVFAPLLVRSFGKGFSGGAIAIVIIGAGFLVGAASGPVDVLLNMLGESRLSLANTGIGLAVNVAGNLLLIPPLGVAGAAWSWALSVTVINVLPLVQVHRRHGLHPFGTRWAAALGVATCYGAVALAARLVLGATIPGLGAGVAAAGSVTAGLVWLGRGRLGVRELGVSLRLARRVRLGEAEAEDLGSAGRSATDDVSIDQPARLAGDSARIATDTLTDGGDHRPRDHRPRDQRRRSPRSEP